MKYLILMLENCTAYNVRYTLYVISVVDIVMHNDMCSGTIV